MKKSVFVLFLALLLSCLTATKGNMAPIFSRHTFKKLSNSLIKTTVFDPSEILIDETQLIGRSRAGKKEDDRIQNLPGQPNVNFKQYGGYVNVNSKTGKAFFYYLVESRKSPNTSPLLLWLNGGPGCSSLGYGAMQELGPFRVQSDGKTLYQNEYAWNKDANVLFLESPAGVGFSYSNTTADFVSGGDTQTAADNYVFLANWLERFPEYKTKDIYFTGESYAGHYVPQLAHTVLYQNKKAKTIINLKGILIGNAWINDDTDNVGVVKFLGSHALISEDLTDQILKYCGLSPKGPQLKQCDEVMDKANKLLDPINLYNIYEPLCHDSNLTDKPKKVSIFKFDPCTEYYVHAYLNQADVQKALHANVIKIPYKWESCNSALRQNWTDWAPTILPSIKEVMRNGLRVWIYSGDVDGNVPVTSTQLDIKEMKLRIKESWHAWYTQGEVGGYTQVYDNLTFATVRDAGHEVPSYQPERAFSLITYFLAGKQLPTS